jgi:hypothetical protein
MEGPKDREFSVTAELEKSQQTNKGLRDRVKTLEVENLKLAEEKVPWQSVWASVQQLGEQFEAFRQSYACDVDKLTGLLLEVQSQLVQRRNVSLLRRIKLALKKTNRPKKSQISSDTQNVEMLKLGTKVK